MSWSNLFLKSAFVEAPLANGMGRFVPQCQRITLKFCKSHGGSRGLREFIERDLVDFAKANPSVVMYLKPRRHRSPVMVAEFLNGHREWMSIENFERDEIYKWIELLRQQGGQGEMRYKNYQRTDYPSIQGPWTPFTHKDPKKNVAAYPNEEYGAPVNRQKTATEVLLEMYGKDQPASSSSKSAS